MEDSQEVLRNATTDHTNMEVDLSLEDYTRSEACSVGLDDKATSMSLEMVERSWLDSSSSCCSPPFKHRLNSTSQGLGNSLFDLSSPQAQWGDESGNNLLQLAPTPFNTPLLCSQEFQDVECSPTRRPQSEQDRLLNSAAAALAQSGHSKKTVRFGRLNGTSRGSLPGCSMEQQKSGMSEGEAESVEVLRHIIPGIEDGASTAEVLAGAVAYIKQLEALIRSTNTRD